MFHQQMPRGFSGNFAGQSRGHLRKASGFKAPQSSPAGPGPGPADAQSQFFQQQQQQQGQKGFAQASSQTFPQQGFQQNGFPQQGFPQNGFPQSGFPQSGFSQPGFPQQGFPQNGFPQPGFPQPGFSQPGFPQSQVPGQWNAYPQQYPYPYNPQGIPTQPQPSTSKANEQEDVFYALVFQHQMQLFFKQLPDELKVLFSSLGNKAQYQMYLYMTGQPSQPPPGLPQLIQSVQMRRAKEAKRAHRSGYEEGASDDDYDDVSDSAVDSELELSDEDLDNELDRIISRKSSLSSILSRNKDNSALDRVLRRYDPKNMLRKELKTRARYRKNFLYDFTSIDPAEVQSKQLGVCPPIDVLEFSEEYVINISLPGASKDEIEVVFDFDKYMLLVKGQIRKYPEEYYKENIRVSERPMGKFERSIPLPPAPRVNERDIETHYKDGILTLRVSKYSDDLNQVHIPL